MRKKGVAVSVRKRTEDLSAFRTLLLLALFSPLTRNFSVLKWNRGALRARSPLFDANLFTLFSSLSRGLLYASPHSGPLLRLGDSNFRKSTTGRLAFPARRLLRWRQKSLRKPHSASHASGCIEIYVKSAFTWNLCQMSRRIFSSAYYWRLLDVKLRERLLDRLDWNLRQPRRRSDWQWRGAFDRLVTRVYIKRARWVSKRNASSCCDVYHRQRSIGINR